LETNAIAVRGPGQSSHPPSRPHPRTSARTRLRLRTGQCSSGEHYPGPGAGRARPGTRPAQNPAPATLDARAATGESSGSRIWRLPSAVGDPHSAPVVVTSQDDRGSAQEMGCFRHPYSSTPRSPRLAMSTWDGACGSTSRAPRSPTPGRRDRSAEPLQARPAGISDPVWTCEDRGTVGVVRPYHS